MPGEEFSLAEIVRIGLDAEMDRLFKACPGEVTAYDPITNTAFVKPATTRARYSSSGKRSYVAIPEIPFVPVLFTRAGDFVLRFPLSPGDTVLLVWCDVSTAEWRETGQQSNPKDARLHGPGWPVAIPGFFPDVKPMSPADAAEIAADGAILGIDGGTTKQILFDGTVPGIRFGKAATMPLALAPPIVAALQAMQAAIVALQSDPTHVASAAAVTASSAAVATAITTLASTLVKAL